MINVHTNIFIYCSKSSLHFNTTHISKKSSRPNQLKYLLDSFFVYYYLTQEKCIQINHFLLSLHFLLLLQFFLKVRGHKTFVFSFSINRQVLITFNLSSANSRFAQAVWEVFNFVVGHSIVVCQLVTLLDVLECFVNPISSIEANSAVRVTGMVNTPT